MPAITIGGFSGPFAAKTWNEVDDALSSARTERTPASTAPHNSELAREAPSYHWSEIAQHNARERGYWLVVHDKIYDVTRLIDRHPGGPAIMRAYAGIDATGGFTRAHCPSRRITRMQDALLIGTVHDPTAQLTAAEAHAHRALVGALQLVTEMQNALELNLLFSLSRGERNTAYDRQRERERAERFEREYVAVLAEQVLPRLHAVLLPLHPSLPAAPRLSPSHTGKDARRNYELLRQLKRGLVTLLRPFELTDVMHRPVRTGWLRLLAALQRHARM